MTVGFSANYAERPGLGEGMVANLMNPIKVIAALLLISAPLCSQARVDDVQASPLSQENSEPGSVEQNYSQQSHPETAQADQSRLEQGAPKEAYPDASPQLPTQNTAPSNSSDILAAWITTGGAVLAAIIAGLFLLFTSRKNPEGGYPVITLDRYEQGLRAREQEVRKALQLSIEQRQTKTQEALAKQQELDIELAVVTEKLGNIEEEHEKHIQVLKNQIASLERYRGQLDDQQLDAAKQALMQGDSRLADQLFEAIYQSGENQLVLMAEAKYQQGLIAEEDIRYQEAFNHFNRAVQLQPENSTYLNQAGLIAQTLANYAKAIELYQLALASDLKTHGEDHPSVARDRNNLGSAYQDLGEFEKAIELYQLALASDLKTHGEEHPSVAIDRNNLGSAYQVLGQYEKAIELYQLALASGLKTHGEDHPDVAIDRNNLGVAYRALGQYEKAIELYQLALANNLKTHGEDHPDVAIDRNNLGSAYQDLGQYEKAIELYQLALASDLKTHGEDHPNVAVGRNNLGEAYRELGQYEKAIELFQLALASDLKTHGEDHPSVARDRNNLGVAYRALGQYEKAIELYQLALASDLKTHGEDHPYVAGGRNNLGGAYQGLGQYEKAIEQLELALEVLIKVLGDEHPNTKTTAQNLAFAREVQQVAARD